MSYDAEFWTARAIQFEKILADYPAARRDDVIHADYLPTGWNGDGWPSRWSTQGGSCEAARDDFRNCASLCAVSGLQLPNSDDAWMSWLDCLFEENIDLVDLSISGSTGDRRPTEDVDTGWRDGAIIVDVCRSSARFARKLAGEASKAAGLNAEQSPTLRRPQQQPRGPRRRAAMWLRREMNTRGFATVNRLAEVAGVDSKTIQKILDGYALTRDDALERIAVGLSTIDGFPKVTVRDIPEN